VWPWRSSGSDDLVQFEACIDNGEENGSGRVNGGCYFLVYRVIHNKIYQVRLGIRDQPGFKGGDTGPEERGHM